MKISKQRLRRIIAEEIEGGDAEDWPEDVEPVEDAWDGGDNLVLPLDHSKAVGGEPVTPEPEVLAVTESILSTLLRLSNRTR